MSKRRQRKARVFYRDGQWHYAVWLETNTVFHKPCAPAGIFVITESSYCGLLGVYYARRIRMIKNRREMKVRIARIAARRSVMDRDYALVAT